jgi:hypothetical protein
MEELVVSHSLVKMFHLTPAYSLNMYIKLHYF